MKKLGLLFLIVLLAGCAAGNRISYDGMSDFKISTDKAPFVRTRYSPLCSKWKEKA